MSDLHWVLRDHLKDFRKDGRLFVLMSIYLHKNIRNRSFPSNDLIAHETGLSSAPISRSIKWLVANHAVMLVPYDKRIGNEKDLPNRKNIYQLTGVINLNGKFIAYLHMNPDGWLGLIQELKDLGNSLICKLLQESDSLQIDSLLGKPKDSTDSSKGIKEESDDATPRTEHKDISPNGEVSQAISEDDLAKEKEKDAAASPPAAPEVEVKSSSDQTEPAPIPVSEEKIPPVNGAAPTPAVPDAKPKKPRPADPEFDLIAKIWNTTAGGHISCVQGMIFGSKKVKGEWLRCQFDPPATLDELAAFEPYARQRMAERHITEIPTAAVTIQRWFYDFRVSRQPKASAIAAPFNLDDWELPQLAKMEGVL